MSLLVAMAYLVVGCLLTPWYLHKIKAVHRAAEQEEIPRSSIRVIAEAAICLWPFVIGYDLLTHFKRWRKNIYEAMQES